MRWWEIVGMEEPSGDTPSVTPFGRASSLREGAGNDCAECVPFNEVLAKPQGFGRFSSPLRNSEDFGLVPFNVPPGNRKGAGDFHRPYEGSVFFTFHRSSGYSLKLGVNLFQEICNIVSVQIKGYFGILMGQVVACAGQEVGDVEGGFCFRGLKDDGGNAAGFQHQ